MEEFYDPLAQFKKLTITDPNILNKHAPKNTNFLQKLPMNLVKRQMEYQQKSPSVLQLDNDSFLLRNVSSIQHLYNCIRTVTTMGNGRLDKRMEEVNCFSLMEVTTQVILKAIKIRGKEFYIIRMAIIILVNGRMTKLMDLEHMYLQAEESIKAIGRMLRNMDQVNRFGKMEQYSRVSTNSTKKVGLESFFTETETHTQVSSNSIKRMGKE